MNVFTRESERRPASRQRAMATTAQLSPAARGTAGVLRLGKPRRCATAPDLARSRASLRGSSARAALFGRGAASSGGRPDGRLDGLADSLSVSLGRLDGFRTISDGDLENATGGCMQTAQNAGAGDQRMEKAKHGGQ